MITLGAGLHPGIPDDVYHADPCEQASLSSSVARIMLDRSPLHARQAHPRLNTAWTLDETSDRTREIGSATHALVLGQGRTVKVIEADSYRTKDAKARRDEARDAGFIPLLSADYETAQAIAFACGKQLADTELSGIFDAGDAEMTAVWQEPGAWCRSRIDFMPRIVREGGHVIVPDYKTTAGSAHPDDFARTIFEQGYDIQAAFYERGLRKLIPSIRSITFVFVVQEQDPPYALSIVGLDGRALELASQRADIAIRMWSTCIATGHWPGYSRKISRVELPDWRAMRTELNNSILLDRLARWQSPLNMTGEAA